MDEKNKVEASLTDQQQKLAIRDICKGITLRTMQDGKDILVELLNVSLLRIPTINDLLDALGREKISYGDYWGWPDLYFDLLSNKYGVAAHYNTKERRSYVKLNLPPVEKLTFMNGGNKT